MKKTPMVTVNLIPGHVALNRTRRRHLRRWTISLAVFAVVLLGGMGWEWLHRADAVELNKEILLVQEQLVKVRAQVRTVSTKAAKVRLQIDRAEALRSKRSWSALLALVASCLPEHSWLLSLATVPERPTASRHATMIRKTKAAQGANKEAVTLDTPRKLTLVGYAKEADEPLDFVSELKSAGVFHKVILVRSKREMIRDGFYFRFEITCEW